MPEQVMQMNTPRFTDAHSGPVDNDMNEENVAK
jgi:hypothetical protein